MPAARTAHSILSAVSSSKAQPKQSPTTATRRQTGMKNGIWTSISFRRMEKALSCVKLRFLRRPPDIDPGSRHAALSWDINRPHQRVQEGLQILKACNPALGFVGNWPYFGLQCGCTPPMDAQSRGPLDAW